MSEKQIQGTSDHTSRKTKKQSKEKKSLEGLRWGRVLEQQVRRIAVIDRE